MAVQVQDQNFGVNGHAKSMRLMRDAHRANTDALLNHAEGVDVDAPRPAYDPTSPDNQWPYMVHHPEKGELTVGKSLIGVADPMTRKRIEKENDAAYDAAIAAGYRDEPYAKPQVVVLDPAAEKAELIRKNNELQGQITALADQVKKLADAKQ